MEELLMYKLFVCDDEGELIWDRTVYPQWLDDIESRFKEKIGLTMEEKDGTPELFISLIEGFQVSGMMRGFKLANKLISEVKNTTLES